MSNFFDDTTFGTTPDNEAEAQVDTVFDGEVVEDNGEGNNSEALGSLLELLSSMSDHSLGTHNNDNDDDDNEDNADDDGMDADDYHNKAVDYANRGQKKAAAEFCMTGLKRLFPETYETSIMQAESFANDSKSPSLNVDLLADTIQYSSDAGDMANAAKHYAVLKEFIPFQRWNWRAFTFAFNYLLKADPVGNEAECRTIVENYKKYLPHEEKASMAESELESALGNAEQSMNVLKEAIRTHTNAPQCALRLADMQLERGLYEDALATTNYGIAASAETQPSINIPYLYYVRTLATDHLLHKKACSGDPINKEDLDALKEDYELLLSEFPELIRHTRTIKMRAKMLKFIKVK